MPEEETNPVRRDPALGVTLSGGGVRASLFALGALTYLVDSRECERVTAISSVSGGSITNGFVAQRCDFQCVQASEFDRIAAQLAKAITTGLISKRFVIATYGFLGVGVILITLVTRSRWPFGVPVWLDVLLIILFGALLLLRGRLLLYLFQRQLFSQAPVQPKRPEKGMVHGIAPDELVRLTPKRKPYLRHPNPSSLPSTLGDIASGVAHIFCATDLNASMPVYFTNIGSHFYSPAWGGAEPKKAGQISVASAVRASAAFPGGIPPMRLDVHRLGVSPTAIQSLTLWQQLVFRDVKKPPSILYLADGGVWNNLGTDWFNPSTASLVLTAVDAQPECKELLVVDASAPTAAKPRLGWFWLPYAAEVLLLFRVWEVSYASTVNARVEDLESRASSEVRSETRRERPLLVRMLDPVSKSIKWPLLAWRGDPDHWSGRWSAWLALKRLFSAQIPSKRLVVRGLARLHERTALVPTTLFRIPPEVAVQVLLHGFVSTAQALARSREQAQAEILAKLPGLIRRFAEFVGLEAHQLLDKDVVFICSTSDWADMKKPELQLEQIFGSLENVLHEERWIGIAIEHMRDALGKEGKEQKTAIEPILEERNEAERKLPLQRLLLDTDIRTAELYVLKQDYPKAVELFKQIFSQSGMSYKSVDSWTVAKYAKALAQTGDAEAREVAAFAENKIQTEAVSSTDGKLRAKTWWTIAEVYALLHDAEIAARCVRASFAQAPEEVHHWLANARNSEEFQSIWDDQAFVMLEREIVAPAGSQNEPAAPHP